MKCPSCGAEANGAYCHQCGTKLRRNHTCSLCGTEYVGNFCPFCGAPANEEKNRDSAWQKEEDIGADHTGHSYGPAYQGAAAHQGSEEPQSRTHGGQRYYRAPSAEGAGKADRYCNKWLAFFLCLFLGGIGVHKFYEGKIGMGLLYLFTGGLFGVGVIIDLITLAMKPNYYLP